MGDAPYDFVWVSPVRAVGFIDYCTDKGIRVAERIALGLNDVKTTMYMGGVAEAFASGLSSRMYQKAWRAVRVPHLFFHERRYLRRCDLVHVQTELEKRRAHRVAGRTNGKPSIVAVPNGRKVELETVQYKGVDSARVLLMTHLAGRRERETSWFIEKVWPEVRRRVPAARLQIVGTPPAASSDLHNRKADGIDIIGYAESLPAMFDSIAVSVVPVFHSTGLNNRVLDSLTAGVPIVATPDALGTIEGLEFGVHALAASTRNEFVDALSGLLLNRDKRIDLAHQARTFGMQQPTWKQGASILAAALRRLQ
jgi:glycosyltransferase involved in cell wall biosynthesis